MVLNKILKNSVAISHQHWLPNLSVELSKIGYVEERKSTKKYNKKTNGKDNRIITGKIFLLVLALLFFC